MFNTDPELLNTCVIYLHEDKIMCAWMSEELIGNPVLIWDDPKEVINGEYEFEILRYLIADEDIPGERKIDFFSRLV